MMQPYYHFLTKILLGIACYLGSIVYAYTQQHATPRVIHYQPDGQDFVCVNGSMRFNRALYGTNTGFRIEAGDLPEFAFYLPGMGGNFQFGLIKENTSKWIIHADVIEARYRPGSMIYTIRDTLLGTEGKLVISVLASDAGEGMLMKINLFDVDSAVQLAWVYGGLSGKKFSRHGDIGADPESSFYLKPEYCVNNKFDIRANNFTVSSPKVKNYMTGTVHPATKINLSSAHQLQDPLQCMNSVADSVPVIIGALDVKGHSELYVMLSRSESADTSMFYGAIANAFEKAELSRKKLAGRVKLVTPDPYLNTLGGALSVAADAIWEYPTYLHGAVAWRMRLNAWRGAYVADPLGWHDRAKAHFSSYVKSQVQKPLVGPVVPDTTRYFARQVEKIGVSMFSNGYICRNPNGDIRPHHYDMNLVFFDQMLTHFYWTGDRSLLKAMWPHVKQHLAWEKRNFDPDNNGLYDAYCCIWASDALQYSGGSVTHSSAYNYRANKLAAQLATLVQDDPVPYQHEADKILTAINKNLWIPDKGWYAEYKDLLGNQLVHPHAGLWTIYHTIDSGVPDIFQAYQALQYVETETPRIPIRAKGFPMEDAFTLSTTNWQPYTWSVNNVALAELLHTALAYWQGNRHEDAYHLWKSSILESFYLSSSPGGFQQLSFYDAMRGELYRDFADPIGMAARSLVEGLFGIKPDLINQKLVIRPGFPDAWEHAMIDIPDVKVNFQRAGDNDVYTIHSRFDTPVTLNLMPRANAANIKQILVNGNPIRWTVQDAIGAALILIESEPGSKFHVEITWGKKDREKLTYSPHYVQGSSISLNTNSAVIKDVKDPQQILRDLRFTTSNLNATISEGTRAGHRLFFVKLQQGAIAWWEAVKIEIRPLVEIHAVEVEGKTIALKLCNNGTIERRCVVHINKKLLTKRAVLKADSSLVLNLPISFLIPGSNVVEVDVGDKRFTKHVITWQTKRLKTKAAPVNLTGLFNDKITNIFSNQYFSPRPHTATLQLPTTGIGNWCYPLIRPGIDDGGLKKISGQNGIIKLPYGVDFLFSSRSDKNVIFVSMWDVYPDSVSIPVTGNAKHAYFLMTGTTNPMQSRIVNGVIRVSYADGTTDVLELKNPQNWWPIEQDLFSNGYAFTTGEGKPLRLSLRTGEVIDDSFVYSSIKGYSERAIRGGAASVLDIPLDSEKELKSITVKAIANDVVIGLIGATLTRK